MLRQRADYTSDSELVDACLEGDDTAWRCLIERYERLIYSIPLRLGLSQAAADDVFQEVCLTLLEKLHTLRDRTRLQAWIVTVTRRTAIAHSRRWSTATNLDDGQDLEDPEDKEGETLVMRLEQRHVLEQGLDRLDARCQKLIRALFLHNPAPSYEELAKELGLAEGSIGPTRARCLEKLRQLMGEIGGPSTSSG
jgi:RNA polymerase sigma factor (sigma-70 family)